MATLSTAVPEGNKPPLLQLDDNHHGSWLVISSAFGLVIILLTLIIRIYLRYKVSPPFAADDIALTVSTALAVIQCALVFAGVQQGDGTSIDLINPDNIVPIQKVSIEAFTQHPSQQLTIATAQLRSKHILRPHALRLESLPCATVQAHLLRHGSQKDFVGRPWYHAHFGLRFCALERASL
jgi:hypothetical protein